MLCIKTARLMNLKRKNTYLALSLVCLAFLSGCEGEQVETSFPQAIQDRMRDERGRMFGDEGLLSFGRSEEEDFFGNSGLAVNSFLWRATLDTVSFMPLASADPFGGVIITDWYEDPNARKERFKATVTILDKRLRADGLKVALFRQILDENGNWRDDAVDASTVRDLENVILTRAREMRIKFMKEE